MSQRTRAFNGPENVESVESPIELGTTMFDAIGFSILYSFLILFMMPLNMFPCGYAEIVGGSAILINQQKFIAETLDVLGSSIAWNTTVV